MNTPTSSSPSPVTRLEAGLIAAVTAAGFVLRVLLWDTQSIVSVDGTAYIRMAWDLLGGPEFTTVHAWGYPALIAVMHWLVSDWVTAAKAVDLVTGLLCIPAVWWLTRAYVRSLALRMLPALAMAALPLPVRYSLTTMSEMPYLLPLLVMFGLAARWRGWPAGLAGGAAFLVRAEALTAVAALTVLLWRRPRVALRLAAGAALIVVPFFLVQGATTGVWSLSQKTINVGGADWRDNEPVAGEATLSPDLETRLEAHRDATVSAYPGRLAGVTRMVLAHGGWVVAVPAVVGLFTPAGPLAAGLVQGLVTPVFALGEHPRFVLPLLPFLWVLAAAGADRFSRPALRWGLAAMAVAGLAYTAVREHPGYVLNEDGYFPELVEAGEWLKPYVGPSTVVYDRKPYTAFYAGAQYRAIPLGGYDATLDAVVEGGGDFLVIDQAVVGFFRPELLPLITDKAVAGNEGRLSPVYLNYKYQNRWTMIYRVVRPGGPRPLEVEPSLRKNLRPLQHLENHYVHGLLAMRNENWSAAAGEFAYVTQAEPENAAAWNNRAWCLLQADLTLPDAERNARKALELDPGNPDYLDTLIEVLAAQGKDEEAARLRRQLEAGEGVSSPGPGGG